MTQHRGGFSVFDGSAYGSRIYMYLNILQMNMMEIYFVMVV
ncbi:hypothetical protein [Desulfosediminicola flagellatus]|nr:hypothetical protein [Desulfosediminicola flagellatus]